MFCPLNGIIIEKLFFSLWLETIFISKNVVKLEINLVRAFKDTRPKKTEQKDFRKKR